MSENETRTVDKTRMCQRIEGEKHLRTCWVHYKWWGRPNLVAKPHTADAWEEEEEEEVLDMQEVPANFPRCLEVCQWAWARCRLYH